MHDARVVSHAPWCTQHQGAEGAALECCGSIRLRVPTQSRNLEDWLEPRFATVSLAQEEDRCPRVVLDCYSGDEMDLADVEQLAAMLVKLVEVARRG